MYLPEDAISMVTTLVRTSQAMLTLKSMLARCIGLPEHSLRTRSSELSVPDAGSPYSVEKSEEMI